MEKPPNNTRGFKIELRYGDVHTLRPKGRSQNVVATLWCLRIDAPSVLIPKLEFLLIPHLIVLWFLRIAAVFVGIAGQIVVLFTGSYPAQLHGFVAGVIRWQVRVNAYFFGLRDEYPPFTLKE